MYCNKSLFFLLILPAFSLAQTQPVTSTTNTTVINTSPGTTIVTPATPSTLESDGRITAAIYAQYGKSSALTGTNLTVVCKASVVTLSGTVTAQSQADEAVRLAKSVPFVKEVISNIVVVTNPGTSVQPSTQNY